MNEVIPDAAVEAAAKAEYEHEMLALEGPWASATKEARALFRQGARVALEAAKPHMAAQVLMDAVDAFPLETITAPDNAVVWLMRRAEQVRSRA